jgi:DNA-binding IclR family transcriptional regulator
VRRARPILEHLSARADETTVLSVARGMDTVPVDQVTVPHVVSVQWIGRKIPAHAAGTGKLLLASLSRDELDAFLAEPLEALSERTITDANELRRQVEQVRRTGVAASIGEYEVGLNSVSSAARDRHGRPIAFVTVTGPNYRLPRERLRELAPLVLAAAQQVTAALSERSASRDPSASSSGSQATRR